MRPRGRLLKQIIVYPRNRAHSCANRRAACGSCSAAPSADAMGAHCRDDRVGAGRASSIEGESEPEKSYKINFFDLRVVDSGEIQRTAREGWGGKRRSEVSLAQ